MTYRAGYVLLVQNLPVERRKESSRKMKPVSERRKWYFPHANLGMAEYGGKTVPELTATLAILAPFTLSIPITEGCLI